MDWGLFIFWTTMILSPIIIVTVFVIMEYINNDYSFKPYNWVKKLYVNGTVDSIYVSINNHGIDFISITNFDSLNINMELRGFSHKFSETVKKGDTIYSAKYGDSIFIIKNGKRIAFEKVEKLKKQKSKDSEWEKYLNKK